MLIVHATVTVDPAAVPDLVRAAADMTTATLAEPGCRHYAIGVVDAAAGTAVIAELWDDLDALRFHFGTPHIAAFQAALGAHVRSMDARMYDAANERPLAL